MVKSGVPNWIKHNCDQYVLSLMNSVSTAINSDSVKTLHFVIKVFLSAISVILDKNHPNYLEPFITDFK